jgi:magnesium chelatase family protein
VPYEKLAAAGQGEPSRDVAERVASAREVQMDRFKGMATMVNADMTPPQVRDYAQNQMAEGANEILGVAVRQLNLSARAFHRVLKVSRTIADLAGSGRIETAHVAEAIQYRERME